MAHFYGTIVGSRGKASRLGTKNSGLKTIAAGWQGAIEVYITEVNGVDHYEVHLIPWQQSGGTSRLLAAGVLDSTSHDQE